MMKNKKRRPGTAEALATPEEELMAAAARWTAEGAMLPHSHYDPQMAKVLHDSARDKLLTSALQYAAWALLDSRSHSEVRKLLEPLVLTRWRKGAPARKTRRR